jgi:hypothetical protein
VRRIGVGDDRRAVRAEDARLLAADRFAVRTEVIDVVDAHAGQYRDVGIDDVHRIEAPAQPDLEDQHLERRFGERVQRAQGAVLEIGERHALARPLHRLKPRHQGLVARLHAGDAHAFVVRDEVR